MKENKELFEIPNKKTRLVNNPEEKPFTFNRVISTKDGKKRHETKTVLGKDLELDEIAILAGRLYREYVSMPMAVRQKFGEYIITQLQSDD